MLTYTEYAAAIKSLGLANALYFARQTGVVLPVAQLWTRRALVNQSTKEA